VAWADHCRPCGLFPQPQVPSLRAIPSASSALPIEPRSRSHTPRSPHHTSKLFLEIWGVFNAAETYAGDDEPRFMSALNQLVSKYGPRPRNFKCKIRVLAIASPTFDADRIAKVLLAQARAEMANDGKLKAKESAA
jgi:hypothetical protein